MSNGFRDDPHVDDPDLLERIGFGEDGQTRRRQRPPRLSSQRRLLRGITMLLALVLVGTAGFYVTHLLSPVVAAMGGGSDSGDEDYEGDGGQEVQVVIPRSASGRQIGDVLQKAGVVKSGMTFAKLAELDERGSKLQPGTYRVKKEMSSKAALAALTNNANRAGSKVTIPEGKWKVEIFQMFSKATHLPVSEFEKVTPAEAGLPADAKGNFEGWLFPATYEVDPSFTAKDYVRQMVDEAKKNVEHLGIAPADYQTTVVKASIIQGEGQNAGDFGKIGRVIENRLDTKMKLGMDSTIHYMFKKRGTAGTSKAERNTKDPYNTYLNYGLPPAPISNPGADALQAAADPAEGNWTYFVTVDPCTGETRFTNDPNEHDRNRLMFVKWDAEHPDGKCS